METEIFKTQGGSVNKTINYYDENAQEYYQLTVDVDMSLLCDKIWE